MMIAEKIGKFKKENNITVLQSQRWDEIISHAITRGEKKGLSAEFIDAIFKAIHQESINHQMKIINSGSQNTGPDL
jgi:chorismate mutase